MQSRTPHLKNFILPFEANIILYSTKDLQKIVNSTNLAGIFFTL